MIGIYFIVDLVILVVYSVLIMESDWAKEHKEQKEHLGWVNSCIIIFTDILLIAWGTLSNKGIFISPLISSIFLLVA